VKRAGGKQRAQAKRSQLRAAKASARVKARASRGTQHDSSSHPTGVRAIVPSQLVGLAPDLAETFPSTLEGWFAYHLALLRDEFGRDVAFQPRLVSLVPTSSGLHEQHQLNLRETEGIEALDDTNHPWPSAIATIFAREVGGDLVVAFQADQQVDVQLFDYGGDLFRRHLENGHGLSRKDFVGPIAPRQRQLGSAVRERVQKLGRVISRHYGSGQCMFPLASGSECGDRAIGSHAISQRAHLALIEDGGRVYRYRRHFLKAIFENAEPTPELVGATSVAAVFPGFCSKHDAEGFREIDVPPLGMNERVAALLHFRALTVDLHTKRASLGWQRDSGAVPDYSALISNVDRLMPMSLRMLVLAYRDRLLEKARIDQLLRSGDYADLRFRWFRLEGRPFVAGCAVACFDQDVLGNALQNQAGSGAPCEYVSVSILPEESSGVVMFTWLAGPRRVGERFVESLSTLGSGQLPEVCLRILLGQSEHVYWSPAWWRGLRDEQREEWQRMMAVGVRPGVLVSLSPLVAWRFNAEGGSW
jgi:hypothetical protein